MPTFVKIGQLVVKVLRFFDFSRWRSPPSWIFEFAKFYWLTVYGGPRPITVPNFVKSVVLLLRYCDFRIFKMAAATILNFWNREILLAIVMESVRTHQCAKFRKNWSISCEDMIFQDGGLRHLGFSNFWNFIGWRCLEGITVPSFVKIGRFVAEILRFCEFSRWRPPPYWISEIVNFYWLLWSAWQTSSKLVNRLRRY